MLEELIVGFSLEVKYTGGRGIRYGGDVAISLANRRFNVAASRGAREMPILCELEGGGV